MSAWCELVCKKGQCGANLRRISCRNDKNLSWIIECPQRRAQRCCWASQMQRNVRSQILSGEEVSMKISEVMNRDIATIPADANLVEAATMMRTRNIGFLPVLEQDKVVGVLTDRDIVIR